MSIFIGRATSSETRSKFGYAKITFEKEYRSKLSLRTTLCNIIYIEYDNVIFASAYLFSARDNVSG